MIHNIYEELKKQSTMMSIEDEIMFIERIMTLNIEDIAKNKNLFFKILSIMETSHSQGLFYIDSSNIDFFKKFSNWVRSFKNIFTDKTKNIEYIAQNMEAIFK